MPEPPASSIAAYILVELQASGPCGARRLQQWLREQKPGFSDMTAYNQEEHLASALNSLLRAGYAEVYSINFETSPPDVAFGPAYPQEASL